MIQARLIPPLWCGPATTDLDKVPTDGRRPVVLALDVEGGERQLDVLGIPPLGHPRADEVVLVVPVGVRVQGADRRAARAAEVDLPAAALIRTVGEADEGFESVAGKCICDQRSKRRIKNSFGVNAAIIIAHSFRRCQSIVVVENEVSTKAFVRNFFLPFLL